MRFLSFPHSGTGDAPDDFGLTRNIVRERMMRDVPVLGEEDVAVQSGDGVYKVNIKCMTDRISPTIDAEFSFDLTGRSAVADNIQLDERYYGQGIGLRLLRNILQFCFWTGIDRLDFQAASTMGGYVWAHNGAQIAEKSRIALALELNGRVMALKEVLAPHDYYPLQDAARLGHCDDLRVLGNAHFRLSPPQVERALANLCDRQLAARLSNNTLIRRPGGTTAGAFALAGSCYYAYIDVCDPVPLVLIRRNIDKKWRSKVLACT